MTEFDASDGQAAAMDIKTSGLKHSVTSDIKSLQRLLREGYASGFAIFKELLQNADDARAQSLLLAAHEGFPRAVNPLLRAPGLIVANDGPVLARHMEGITSASGGSKADERAAVGRFGLGQKSVYHLCDAFFALGWVVDDEGKPLILLMNPWNGMAAAHHACTDWKNLDRADAQILLDQTRGLGMQAGLALFLPLRSAELMPGPGLCLSQDTWQPDEAIDKLLTGEEIAATLCCLRHIETILIHQLPETQPLSVGFFSARNASVGAVSGMVLVSASPPNGPAPTHFRPLCLSFFSSGLVSVLGPTFNIGAGLHAVGCRWQLLAQSGTRVEETQAIAQDDRRSRCVPAASSADGMPRYTRYLRTIGASVPMSHRLGAT